MLGSLLVMVPLTIIGFFSSVYVLYERQVDLQERALRQESAILASKYLSLGRICDSTTTPVSGPVAAPASPAISSLMDLTNPVTVNLSSLVFRGTPVLSVGGSGAGSSVQITRLQMSNILGAQRSTPSPGNTKFPVLFSVGFRARNTQELISRQVIFLEVDSSGNLVNCGADASFRTGIEPLQGEGNNPPPALPDNEGMPPARKACPIPVRKLWHAIARA